MQPANFVGYFSTAYTGILTWQRWVSNLYPPSQTELLSLKPDDYTHYEVLQAQGTVRSLVSGHQLPRRTREPAVPAVRRRGGQSGRNGESRPSDRAVQAGGCDPAEDVRVHPDTRTALSSMRSGRRSRASIAGPGTSRFRSRASAFSGSERSTQSTGFSLVSSRERQPAGRPRHRHGRRHRSRHSLRLRPARSRRSGSTRSPAPE